MGMGIRHCAPELIYYINIRKNYTFSMNILFQGLDEEEEKRQKSKQTR